MLLLPPPHGCCTNNFFLKVSYRGRLYKSRNINPLFCELSRMTRRFWSFQALRQCAIKGFTVQPVPLQYNQCSYSTTSFLYSTTSVLYSTTSVLYSTASVFTVHISTEHIRINTLWNIITKIQFETY